MNTETGVNNSSAFMIFMGLLSMAVFAFCLGLNEFITIGLLPNIAHTYSISIPTAGELTSMFTLGAGVSAPIIAYATLKMPRKHILSLLIVVFIIAAVISAVAPTYDYLLTGRVLTSLCHGSFFGIGVVVVSSMVRKEKAASAIAFMFTGLTVSNLVGVPVGTYLGNEFGWHYIFWGLVVISIIAFIGILFFIPNKAGDAADTMPQELKVFKLGKFWLAFFTAAFGYCGMLSSYTYMAKLMTTVSGFSHGDIAWLTAVYGLGAVIGNYIGGKIADKFGANKAVCSLLSLLAVILYLFTFTAHFKVPSLITLFFLGVVGFSLIAPLMQYVIARSNGAATMAATANITGLGLGITLGVYLSGLAIGAGWGYTAPNWIGGVLTTIGLGCALLGILFAKGKKAQETLT